MVGWSPYSFIPCFLESKAAVLGGGLTLVHSNFQPSEFGRIVVVLVLAVLYGECGEARGEWWTG